MIRLTKTGVIAHLEDVERLRSEFQEKSCVQLRNLLDESLLTFLLDGIEHGAWEAEERKGFDSRHVLLSGPAIKCLQFVTNWPRFLDVVHEITGCGPFTWFGGVVYRMAPAAGHYDAWHTDDTDGRLVALSLNLSSRGYQGGVLQMRERGSEQLLVEIANTGPGDALLFRISKNLLHQVTEVTGVEAKTAFAGWFNATAPSFADRLPRRRPSIGIPSAKPQGHHASPDA